MVTSEVRDPYRLMIVDELAYSYEGVCSRDEIAGTVADTRQATFTQFLPVLVAKQVREQLMAQAQASGRRAKTVQELLFVCVHNAGRSQMAAALAEHLSARRVHVRSAGSQPANPINPVVVEVLAERGIASAIAYPKPLTDSVLQAADVIITMDCGDSCP